MSKSLILIVVMLCGVLGCTTPKAAPEDARLITGPDVSQKDFVTTWEVTGHELTIQTGEGEFGVPPKK